MSDPFVRWGEAMPIDTPKPEPMTPGKVVYSAISKPDGTVTYFEVDPGVDDPFDPEWGD